MFGELTVFVRVRGISLIQMLVDPNTKLSASVTDVNREGSPSKKGHGLHFYQGGWGRIILRTEEFSCRGKIVESGLKIKSFEDFEEFKGKLLQIGQTDPTEFLMNDGVVREKSGGIRSNGDLFLIDSNQLSAYLVKVYVGEEMCDTTGHVT